jgi:hypothetical protein
MGYLNNGLWVRHWPLVKDNLYARVIFEGPLDRKLRHSNLLSTLASQYNRLAFNSEESSNWNMYSKNGHSLKDTFLQTANPV